MLDRKTILIVGVTGMLGHRIAGAMLSTVSSNITWIVELSPCGLVQASAGVPPRQSSTSPIGTRTSSSNLSPKKYATAENPPSSAMV